VRALAAAASPHRRRRAAAHFGARAPLALALDRRRASIGVIWRWSGAAGSSLAPPSRGGSCSTSGRTLRSAPPRAPHTLR